MLAAFGVWRLPSFGSVTQNLLSSRTNLRVNQHTTHNVQHANLLLLSMDKLLTSALSLLMASSCAGDDLSLCLPASSAFTDPPKSIDALRNGELLLFSFALE
jgi:hypothetical protein